MDNLRNNSNKSDVVQFSFNYITCVHSAPTGCKTLLLVNDATCELQHKLHILKKSPWRWPTVKAETCRDVN